MQSSLAQRLQVKSESARPNTRTSARSVRRGAKIRLLLVALIASADRRSISTRSSWSADIRGNPRCAAGLGAGSGVTAKAETHAKLACPAAPSQERISQTKHAHIRSERTARSQDSSSLGCFDREC